MENQVEEVKSKVDIVALVGETVQLKKAGRNFKGLCPFHGEKTPSFMVNPERQIFKCFGCGEGGDAISFVEKNERVSFPEALKILADRVGIKLKQVAPDPREKQKETFFKINSAAAELYHFLLTKHDRGKQALDYLKTRGISSASIKTFKLGFAPVVETFASDYLTKKGYTQPELVNSGISLPSQRNKGVYDRFRGRIIFPIRDSAGRTVGFSGRILGSGEPKYLNSPDSVVFNKSNALFGIDLARGEISRAKKAVLVEGNLDVISSYQMGVTNVVCPLGTALTEGQVNLIKRFADELVLAFDSDSAGVGAAKRAIELAENQGVGVKVADLENFKDPDELIRAEPKNWTKALDKAIPIYDFVINTAVKRWSGQGAEGKRKVIAEVVPYLRGLTDAVLQDHYLKLLADRLGINEASIRLQLTKSTNTLAEVKEKSEEKKDSVLEEYFLALYLAAETAEPDANELWFQKADNKALLELFKKEFATKDRLKVKDFLAKIPVSLTSKFDEILLQDIDEKLLASPELLEKEIVTTKARLEKLFLKHQMGLLTLAIKQAEATKEEARLSKLTDRFRAASEKLSALDQND